jgi:hypothetical protein
MNYRPAPYQRRWFRVVVIVLALIVVAFLVLGLVAPWLSR